MNGSNLEALRRRLFYSVAEAARLVAADEGHPDGIEERSWNRWEAGVGRPLTVVTRRLAELGEQRDMSLEMAREAIKRRVQLLESGWMGPAIAVPGDEGQPTRLVWYREADDFHLKARVYWRPYCSVVAQLVAEDLAVLVPFDAPAYNRWRVDQAAHSRQSEAFLRQAWAATAPRPRSPFEQDDRA